MLTLKIPTNSRCFECVSYMIRKIAKIMAGAYNVNVYNIRCMILSAVVRDIVEYHGKAKAREFLKVKLNTDCSKT